MFATEAQSHRGVTEKTCRGLSLARSFRRHPRAWHGDPRVWWAQPRIDPAESHSTATLCFEKVVDARAKHEHDGAWGGFGAFVGVFFSVPSLCLCASVVQPSCFNTEKKCRRLSLACSFRRRPRAWHGDPRVWWAQPRIDAAESRSTAMLCFEKVVDARAKHKHDGAWGDFGAFVGAFFSLPSLCLCASVVQLSSFCAGATR
jgi:hypothetical protein